MKPVPKRPNGLEKRGKHWRYRRTIPAELVPLIGKTAFTKSFKTSDYQEALKGYPMALVEAENVINAAARKLKLLQSEQARVEGVLHVESLSNEEIQSIVLSWFHKQEFDFVPIVDDAIKNSNSYEVLDGLKCDLEVLQTDSEAYIDSSDSWIQKETENILREHSININRDSKEYALISKLVRRGLEEIRERRISSLSKQAHIRDSYFNGVEYESPLPEKIKRNAPKAKVTVQGLLEKYLAEKRLASKSRLQYEQHLIRFAEYIGEATSITDICRDDFVEYRALLKKVPTNASKRFPGLTFKQVVNSSKAKDFKTLHPRTINKTFESLSTLFGFAEDWQLIPKNPAKKLQLATDVDDDDNRVRPYSINELKTIFQAPLYTGCVDDERNYSRTGKCIIRRHRFWVPLIALFSGMRLNEICQLYVEDIKEEDGIYYIAIREKLDSGRLAGDKSLKNESAKRNVPLHSELLKLGFLDYVQAMSKQKSTRLFPDLAFGATGYSDSFQKWYRRFLISTGLKSDGRALCFHSFRHTFRDKLREAKIFTEYCNRICGWTESQSTGRHYGVGVPIAIYAEQIEKICYEELDLSHLYIQSD